MIQPPLWAGGPVACSQHRPTRKWSGLVAHGTHFVSAQTTLFSRYEYQHLIFLYDRSWFFFVMPLLTVISALIPCSSENLPLQSILFAACWRDAHQRGMMNLLFITVCVLMLYGGIDMPDFSQKYQRQLQERTQVLNTPVSLQQLVATVLTFMTCYLLSWDTGWVMVIHLLKIC